jgi:hypothetical protein
VRWGSTPIGDEIQERIRTRVGVSDLNAEDPRSRPARICSDLARLIAEEALSSRFTALDVACGDGLILRELKERFPEAACYGIDANVDQFPAHREVRESGVELFRVLIQDLFDGPPPVRLDVVMMLNTYRSWGDAGLSESELGLPQQVDAWLRANVRHIVLTMTRRQAVVWSAHGFGVQDLGPGEDESRLVRLTKVSRWRAPYEVARSLFGAGG